MDKIQIAKNAVAAELIDQGISMYCREIASMFDVQAQYKLINIDTVTTNNLKKSFDKLVSVNRLQAEGHIQGQFFIVIDKPGLFILSGIVLGLDTTEISENASKANAKNAQENIDAMTEAGNIMKSSLDKSFHLLTNGNIQCSYNNTFIGNPWSKPEKTIELNKKEQLAHFLYEISIAEYDPFHCSVTIPVNIIEPELLVPNTDQTPEQTIKENQGSQNQTPDEHDPHENEIREDKPDNSRQQSNTPDNQVNKEQKKADTVSIETVSEQTAAQQKSKTPVSDSIQKMSERTVLSQQYMAELFSTKCAGDMMRSEVLWISPDDSVEQANAKIKQSIAGYLMVGADDVLEGIVSKSDLAAATSPYLKPIFSKWRRPQDDATLKIKIKWIMRRPVHTVKLNTSVSFVIDYMNRFKGRCLPVTDTNGSVKGIITVFDVFNFILKNTSEKVKTPV